MNQQALSHINYIQSVVEYNVSHYELFVNFGNNLQSENQDVSSVKIG
jgi:hypothetical protein